MRTLFASTLLGLALTAAASARTVPSCPVGSQQSTWKGTRGDNRYNCKLLPVKKDAHGLEQCLEWEGTHWSNNDVTVPCGSSVSNVSDSDQPAPPNSDPPSESSYSDASNIELMGLCPKDSFQKANSRALSLGYSFSSCQDRRFGSRSCEYKKEDNSLYLIFQDHYGLQRVDYVFAGGESAYTDELNRLTSKYGKPHEKPYRLEWFFNAGDGVCSFDLSEVPSPTEITPMPLGSSHLALSCGSPKMNAEIKALAESKALEARKAVAKAPASDDTGSDIRTVTIVDAIWTGPGFRFAKVHHPGVENQSFLVCETRRNDCQPLKVGKTYPAALIDNGTSKAYPYHKKIKQVFEKETCFSVTFRTMVIVTDEMGDKIRQYQPAVGDTTIPLYYAMLAKPDPTDGEECHPSPTKLLSAPIDNSKENEHEDSATEAERYVYGRGPAQDCDRGLRLLKTAAEQSNAKALISLGALYSTGTCTPRDLPTAYRWFVLALHKEPDNQTLQNDLQKLWNQMTQPERQSAIELSQ